MPRNRESRADLLAENRLLRRFNRSSGWSSVLRTAFKWGAMVLIARALSPVLIAFAGETTVADVGLHFLGNMTMSHTLAWSFGGLGTLYGLLQRKLRRDTIQRLGGRVQRLEQIADPARSSSKLTSRGETNPADRE